MFRGNTVKVCLFIYKTKRRLFEIIFEGVWCYAEKGKKSLNSPTFLFLHGFGGTKDDWPSIIKSISSNNHVVVVDLPGHGETTYLQNHDKPTVDGYTDSLKEFLEEIDLNEEDQIYLIGFETK